MIPVWWQPSTGLIPPSQLQQIPPPQPPLIPSSQLPLPDLPIQPRPLHVPDNEGYQDVYQFINDDPDPTYKGLTQTSSTSSDVYAVSSHQDSEHSSSCKSSQSSESPKHQNKLLSRISTLQCLLLVKRHMNMATLMALLRDLHQWHDILERTIFLIRYLYFGK